MHEHMFERMAWRFTEEQVREAIGASYSWSEAVRRLGLRSAGGNYLTLKKYTALWGIETEHFDRRRALRQHGWPPRRIPLEEILVEHSAYSRNHLKDRLFEEGVKERRCEFCAQGEKWLGRRMALILDHANGIADDNRLENLRILCPNCAATLDTHCGRKNLAPPVFRECLTCGKAFRVKYRTHRYCRVECARRSPDRQLRFRGLPRPEDRRVERPPYWRLLEEIEELGYRGIGRKYGVSDNAIRKWERQYEREMDLGDFSAI